MSLEQRLRLLRGSMAAADSLSRPGAEVRPSLAERLRRLGAGGRPALTRPAGESGLAEALGAEQITPGVLRVERRRPLAEPHGRGCLTACAEALPLLLERPVGDPQRWLFLDTETSGLAGGTGTWAFLFGAAWIRGGELVLRQYLLTGLDAERRYLQAVACELGEAEGLVTYNGKGFDAPLLATRLRLAGLGARLDEMRHLDLLAWVRRVFGRVWPDCRLVTAERRLLGLERRDDLPGSEAPAAWLDWLRRGETGALTGVLGHNRQDLIALPALVGPLASTLHDPASWGADLAAVARHHLRRGDSAKALELLAGNRPRLDPAGLLDLARLYRRRGDWGQAVKIWAPLAEQSEPEAIESLAKHLEHRLRDPSGALALARRLPPGPDRERRCRRLERQLGLGWA